MPLVLTLLVVRALGALQGERITAHDCQRAIYTAPEMVAALWPSSAKAEILPRAKASRRAVDMPPKRKTPGPRHRSPKDALKPSSPPPQKEMGKV